MTISFKEEEEIGLAATTKDRVKKKVSPTAAEWNLHMHGQYTCDWLMLGTNDSRCYRLLVWRGEQSINTNGTID